MQSQGFESVTVGSALRELVCHPVERLIYGWNWKSAVTSSGVRAMLFFFANLSAGPAAAVRALTTELLLRGVTAGVYGSITQGFRKAEPRWAGMLVVLIVVPILTHSLEFAVHWLRGTAHLGLSIFISACFTAVSTAFNLFAMREDLLIVGEGQKSLGQDMKAMPRLIGAFLAASVLLPFRLVKTYVGRDSDSDEMPEPADSRLEPLQETGGIG